MTKNDKKKQRILKEPLYKVMQELAFPAIAAMVLFGLNAFMDTVYIGQLMNETALSGVALAYPLSSVLMGLGSWAGTGAANLLSIALGEEDEETQQKVLPNATLFSLIITLILALPAYFFSKSLIAMMGGEGQILIEGASYFKITMLAAPLWVYGLTTNMIVRGEGKMGAAAIMMTYGLVINIALTPIFIGILHWGVAGAAWASNISMMIYSIVGYLYFSRGKASFKITRQFLAYDQKIFLSIMKMGLPGFILTVMGLVQAIIIFNAITNYGTANDLAYFAGANRFLLLLMTPLFGLMRALQPIAGINFGAGQYDRVKKSFWLFIRTGILLILPFWLMLTFLPSFCMKLVLPNMTFSPQDLFNLQIFMLVLPILPVVLMALTLIPAINEEKHASIIGLARQLVFYVPVMLIFPRYFGIEWVYYGSTLIDLVITIWTLLVIRQLFKKLNRVSTG